ncbi:hypothetical protein B9Q03_11010 [Candidatus Marsarchaeota G2 archaeon OSP_D]|uniref:Copper resistance protein D domain-containing protein n=4 Tax=Candidatus Marsarchaeota group 2 TaxID=2203771 RepID=A0A2R6B7K7_9ARCH|nr:MAG: hypothetical protein B9Q03_11010 [Candidatus Marsarchaeota G2 archaeon OSP_D]PSN94621.1 MAG: hypothetical protein B9Q06_08570 [Candidatus Marsarchaeota G2 archaeon ECH_B_2]PSN96150.1 MAG: hypothetical protein B9Q06_03475 [Candidatus Marsarchaeota G2 archaeon ECH_B_2]PSN98344.1 MAG: hypothetical protein B9Q07_10030 [Candidatus Marsarchaeota G2 archaeon ECH_B_3]PSO02649.1 MAG: hypothetical protein B9Q05_03860 [Candidatus Marsarchaeota G2 archaeon ECH_B_1]
MALLQLVILYIHTLSAIIFVGGSLFIWLAFLPALGSDIPEGIRNQVVVRVTRRFGKVVNISLVILVLTGIYNATWYLDGFSFRSLGARILLAKAVLTLFMIFSIYFNNLYLGRRISSIVREMNSATTQEARESLRSRLSSTRRRSRVFSYLNIALMLAVILLAVMLQIPP